MTAPTPTPSDSFLRNPPDFSLVHGGPLFQLLLRAHLSDDALELARQRIIVIALLAWLPLLVLSALEGQLIGGSVAVPFLMDVEVHIKFLVALPLMVGAELVVHRRMRLVVKQFLERNLIPEHAMPRFDAAIHSAFRLRNSAFAEVLLLAFVYGVGILVIWRHYTGTRCAHLVRDAFRGRLQSLVRGNVVRLPEPADFPVPAASLVFPPVCLGTLSLAGVAHRA